MITISVIVGSTRQGRFSEKPAQWILEHLQKRDGIEARLLDLRDFPMPFFDQAVPPAMPGRAPYENEVVKRWTAQFQGGDVDKGLALLETTAKTMIDDLLWWTAALKAARAGS